MEPKWIPQIAGNYQKPFVFLVFSLTWPPRRGSLFGTVLGSFLDPSFSQGSPFPPLPLAFNLLCNGQVTFFHFLKVFFKSIFAHFFVKLIRMKKASLAGDWHWFIQMSNHTIIRTFQSAKHPNIQTSKH